MQLPDGCALVRCPRCLQLLRLGPDVLAGRLPVHCRGCYRQVHDLSDEPAVAGMMAVSRG